MSQSTVNMGDRRDTTDRSGSMVQGESSFFSPCCCDMNRTKSGSLCTYPCIHKQLHTLLKTSSSTRIRQNESMLHIRNRANLHSTVRVLRLKITEYIRAACAAHGLAENRILKTVVPDEAACQKPLVTSLTSASSLHV